jgi:hypothetical protein
MGRRQEAARHRDEALRNGAPLDPELAALP